MRVISHDELGFEMAYPDGWVRSEWKRPGGADGDSPLEYILAYADPAGAQVGGSYVDAVQVSIYRLNRSVEPEDIDRPTANKIIGGVMLRDLPELRVTSKQLKEIEARGARGWQLSYEYEIEGQTVMASSVLLAKGKRAYWVTLQADSYSWRTVNPILGTCLDRFRLL